MFSALQQIHIYICHLSGVDRLYFGLNAFVLSMYRIPAALNSTCQQINTTANMAFPSPPPPPPATEKDESPENNDGNMGIKPFEKQLCKKTIKATREKCKVEIEKQTQELKKVSCVSTA